MSVDSPQVPRRRRGLRRGAVAQIVAVFILIIAAMFARAFIVGRNAIKQQQLQNASDAVTRGSALIAQKDGVGPSRRLNELLPLVRDNNIPSLDNVPALFVGSNPSGKLLRVDTRLDSAMRDLEFPGLTGTSSLPVWASSRVQVKQHVIGDVARDRPKMVLVLDYSGSMSGGYGGTSRIAALRSSVRALLDLNLRVKYGLVIFASGVKEAVAISDNSVAAIRAALGRSEGGGTHTDTAVQRAGQLLRATDRKYRNILVVSDGQPNSGHHPQSEARGLRMNDDVSVYTLSISGSVLVSMKEIAGAAGDPNGRDGQYYFLASNEASMQDTFREVVRRILCRTPVVDPAPSPSFGGSYRVFGFLRDRATGAETPLGPLTDGRISYEAAERTFQINRAQDCEKIIEGTHSLVVRYDMPTLVD